MGQWLLSRGGRRLQLKGKGVLEPDDGDKEDLQRVRSQSQKEVRTLE